MEFNVHKAKTQFSRLLDLALEGEEVIVTRNGTPIVALVPARKRGLELGAGRGEANVESDDWWKPLSDEEADAFLKGRS